MKKKFRSFEEARSFIHSLNISGQNDWVKFCASGNKPHDIPTNPQRTYKNEWKGWGDWLGTNRISNSRKLFCSFLDARKYTHELKLGSKTDWGKFCASGKKPNDIPSTPREVYKNMWKGWGDWLGTGRVANFDKKWRTFEKAKKYVLSLRLTNEHEWKEYRKSSKKPADIPSNPHQVYKNSGWKGMGDWLGTNSIAPSKREFRSFEDARKYVHSLNIKNQHEWNQYSKSGKKPNNIPQKPSRTYSTNWKGYGDWLGTYRISNQEKSKKWMSFKDARKFVSSLGLRNQKDWIKFIKNGNKPDNIPSYPWEVYNKNRKQNDKEKF
jgi:hypothetical protein